MNVFLFKVPFSRHARVSKLPLVIWLNENVVFCGEWKNEKGGPFVRDTPFFEQH